MEITHERPVPGVPWNKGKLVGQKAALKQREIWGIRIRLQLAERTRELALFNLAVDSKLRYVTSCGRLVIYGLFVHAHPVIRQPAAVLCKAKVAVALAFTGFPSFVKEKVAGTTAYARSPVMRSCRGFPTVPVASVIPFFCK
jgi:hypothetical protein